MNRFVVDASVAIKWFLPEVHVVTADQKLHRATRGGRLSSSVLWVGDVG